MVKEALPEHQISLYLERGVGWNMSLICYRHDEYECAWQQFLEEAGAEEFMSRYTGQKHQILRVPAYFTATDEYDMTWSNTSA